MDNKWRKKGTEFSKLLHAEKGWSGEGEMGREGKAFSNPDILEKNNIV